MEEKYIFALLGIALGAILSTVLSIVRELYAEHRSKRKDAEYLAIRAVCMFDKFIDGCVEVVKDNGYCHGQRLPDGTLEVQVSTPKINLNLLDDANWKSLSTEHMYAILSFPSLVRYCDDFIASVYELQASPPDYIELFEARHEKYSELGQRALVISTELKKTYNISDLTPDTNWIFDVNTLFRDTISEVKNKRSSRHMEEFTRPRAMKT